MDFVRSDRVSLKTYGKKNNYIPLDQLEKLGNRDIFETSNSNEDSPLDAFDRLLRDHGEYKNIKNTCRNERTPKPNQKKTKPTYEVGLWVEPQFKQREPYEMVTPKIRNNKRIKQIKQKENEVQTEDKPPRKLDKRYYQNWAEIDKHPLVMEPTHKPKRKTSVSCPVDTSNLFFNTSSTFPHKPTNKNNAVTSTPMQGHSRITFGGISPLPLNNLSNFQDTSNYPLPLHNSLMKVKPCAVILNRVNDSLIRNGSSPCKRKSNGVENLCNNFGRLSTSKTSIPEKLTSRDETAQEIGAGYRRKTSISDQTERINRKKTSIPEKLTSSDENSQEISAGYRRKTSISDLTERINRKKTSIPEKLTSGDENSQEIGAGYRRKTSISDLTEKINRKKTSIPEKLTSSDESSQEIGAGCRRKTSISDLTERRSSNKTARTEFNFDMDGFKKPSCLVNGEIPSFAKKLSVLSNSKKSDINADKHQGNSKTSISTLGTDLITSKSRQSVIAQQQKRCMSPDFEALNTGNNTKFPRLTTARKESRSAIAGQIYRNRRRTTLMQALTPHDSSITGQSICGPTNVLNYCGQPTPTSFLNFLRDYTILEKVGEGSFGEIFKGFNDRGEEIVLKIQAIVDDETNTFDNQWPEIVCTCRLSELRYDIVNRTSTFTHVKKINCIQGVFPTTLLKLWDEYHETKGSESDRPDYDTGQIYVGYEVGFGGSDLESFKFQSAVQAKSIFLQVVAALAVAEKALEFEHRDLHWGNILVAETSETHVEFILEGNHIQVETHNVRATIIDFGLSRLKEDVELYIDLDSLGIMSGRGDYQFDIYRLMRDMIRGKWSDFYPKTNILWLNYLIDKLTTSKQYPSKRRGNSAALKLLKFLEFEISNYKSAYEFVNKHLDLYS